MSTSILILGGGTFYHVRNHLSIATPAFGTTARWLHKHLEGSDLVLTKMAEVSSSLETNEDVRKVINTYLEEETLQIIIMNIALCDYEGKIGVVHSGKHAQRLQSREGQQLMELTPSNKLIASIKEKRPDVFLVGFKTTTNFTPQEQQIAASRMLSEANVDLVLANDTTTRYNLLINAKNECLITSKDRMNVLNELITQLKISLLR